MVKHDRQKKDRDCHARAARAWAEQGAAIFEDCRNGFSVEMIVVEHVGAICGQST